MTKSKLLLAAALSSLAITGITVTEAAAHPGPGHTHRPTPSYESKRPQLGPTVRVPNKPKCFKVTVLPGRKWRYVCR